MGGREVRSRPFLPAGPRASIVFCPLITLPSPGWVERERAPANPLLMLDLNIDMSIPLCGKISYRFKLSS